MVLFEYRKRINNQDNYHYQVSEEATDIFAGDIYASLCHVRARAALQQMQQWVQTFHTLNSPAQAGHRSHATSNYGVRLDRQRGDNLATQTRVAFRRQYKRR